jgi:hypothetical protein
MIFRFTPSIKELARCCPNRSSASIGVHEKSMVHVARGQSASTGGNPPLTDTDSQWYTDFVDDGTTQSLPA